MKRWLKTCVLTMLFLLVGLAFPRDSLAAETLALSDAAASRGEVTLTLTLNSELARSGSVNICYDSTELVFVRAERCEGAWSGVVNKVEEGKIRANFASTTALAANTELYTLTFRIDADTPSRGTEVSLREARLYDVDGILLECETFSGTVYGREGIQLQVGSAESTPRQTVQIGVSMKVDNASGPAGGSFFMEYDPALLEPVKVVPGAALTGAQLVSNLSTAGIVKISFAGTAACPEGDLCSVIFRVLDSAPGEAALSLRNSSMQDVMGADIPVETTDGAVAILAPSESAPKLQVTDAVIAPDGSAVSKILLNPRALVCGGELTLKYDPSMRISVQAAADCVYKLPQDGVLRVSWAASTPGSEEQVLMTLVFQNAVESMLELVDVALYQADGTAVKDLEICSGVLAEEAIEITYEASTGTIELSNLPEQTAMAFAMIYTDGMASASASGTTVIELPDEDLSEGDYIKVFYLDSNYCPVARPGYIKI